MRVWRIRGINFNNLECCGIFKIKTRKTITFATRNQEKISLINNLDL